MWNVPADIWKHPANRSTRLKSLGRAIRWQLHYRLSGRSMDINYHGMTLRCPPGNHSASRAIYFSGLPDYAEMQFMLDYLRPGDQVIDAGANIGVYTLLALSVVGSGGRVEAIEPNPAVLPWLRDNLRINNALNVTIHEVGLADRQGTAILDTSGNDCIAHVVSNDRAQYGSLSHHEIRMDRLDSILQASPFAMAKFDLEGYEPFALRGLSTWLRHANPPVLMVEMGGYSRRYGVATSAFVDELGSLGYDTVQYDPAEHRIRPDPRPWESPGDNVLVIARCQFEEVSARIGAGVH